eukprot:1344894-Pyramimonas_sp.AAC.1
MAAPTTLLANARPPQSTTFRDAAGTRPCGHLSLCAVGSKGAARPLLAALNALPRMRAQDECPLP